MEEEKLTTEQESVTEPQEELQAVPQEEPQPEPQAAPQPHAPASPPRRKKQTLLLLLGTLLVLFLVYSSTSLIYKISRGESWDPFAFLKRPSTTEQKLPTVVTVPPQVLTSLIQESSTEAPTAPPAAVTSTTAVTTETSPEAISETTSEASTKASTEATTEATTEAPTTETTTAKATTEVPATETTAKATTESSTGTDASTDPLSTESEPDFTQLSNHLSLASFPADQLAGSQLIIVQGRKESHAILYFFEKEGGEWGLSEAVPAASAVLGKNRIVKDKSAGSTDIPAGYYPLGPVFGLGEKALTSLPYQQIQENDCWITDPASTYYNQLVDASLVKKDWISSLDLGILSRIYKYAILVAYNTQPVSPKLGTAVFLNVQGDTEPAASISLPEPTLFALLSWLTAEADPHILIYEYETDTK